MNSSARLDDLAQRFQEDPRRYFAPLANEYRKSGQADRAVELCRDQLAQNEGHLSGHVVLALALHDLGERDEARRAYQEALQLDPENVLVLRSLGDLARESGEPATARDWYERAMGVDPRDPEVARRLAALEQEQEQQSISVSDLSFTAALAAAELRHRAEDEPEEDEPEEDEPEEDEPEAAAPVEPVEADADSVSSERDVMDGAAEFTAGFFATALDQPVADEAIVDEAIVDEAIAEEDIVDGAIAAPSGAEQPIAEQPVTEQPVTEQPMDDDIVIEAAALGELTPVADDAGGERVEPDMDRLFAELEPITDDLLGTEQGPQEDLTEPAELEEPLGADLAIADGASVMPDHPPMPELGELPTLEVFHDVQELEEVPAEEVSAEESAADQQASDLGVEAALGAAADETHPPLSTEEGPTPLVADEWTMSLDSIGFEPEPAEYSATSSAPDPGVAFVTETMAQLYMQQGLTQQALGVYRQLAEQRPHEQNLHERVAELEARLEAERTEVVGQPAVAPHEGTEDEPPAASWLSRLVRARPTVLGLPAVAEPQAPVTAPEGAPVAGEGLTQVQVEQPTLAQPEAVSDEDIHLGAAEMGAFEEGALDEGALEEGALEEQEGAEELVVPPAAEADGHDVPAFEWAIPDADLEAQTGVASEESAAVDRDRRTFIVPGEAAAERVSAEPDDDPWIFEGERMSAAGFSGAWKSVDDTGVDAAAGHAAGASSGETGVGPEMESAAAAETRAPLTLDELFARPVPVVEEQAAGALAAATVSMQDDPEVNAQLGEAVAEDPSSLLHVLRGTPRSVASLRQGASFSFDQFFRVDEQVAPTGSGSAGAVPGEERHEPATPQDTGTGDGGTESSDDLADFHAWLSGLSKS